MRTPHFKIDGTLVEEVDGAFLKTWRVSGDWVALITLHRGSTQTLVATAEFLRMCNAISTEVQIITLKSTTQHAKRPKL